jgi:hypothetical protein
MCASAQSGASADGVRTIASVRPPVHQLATAAATRCARWLSRVGGIWPWWLAAKPVAPAGLEVVAEVRRLAVRFLVLVAALDRAELLQRVAILRAVRDLWNG